MLPEQGYGRKRFLTIENNTGQMVDDVRLAIRSVADSDFFNGTLEIDSDELYATLTLTAIVYRRTESLSH